MRLNQKNEFPFVSVVVPVLNREKSIGNCLKSLVDMDYPSYEVIVVDNGSTDNTVQIVKEFRVRLVREKRKGPYMARNAGIKAARGGLILFIDSDCLATTNLLHCLVKEFRNDTIAGVGGPIISHQPETLVEDFGHLAGIHQYSYPRGILKWNKKKFLSGGIFTSNAMFRKDVLEKLHHFDDDFMSGGDYDFCWRLQRAGYLLYFTPDAVVYHKHRGNLWGLVKQFFKYGKEQPKLLKKQPEGFSFVKIKTYIFDHIEFRFKSPLKMLVNIDTCTLLPFSIAASVFSRFFLFLSGILLFFTLFGTGLLSARIVKKSGQMKWLVFFPFFHLARDYSFSIGRIYGGIKQKVLSF